MTLPPTLGYEPHRDDKHTRRARTLARNHPGLVISTVLLYAIPFIQLFDPAHPIPGEVWVACAAGQFYFALRMCLPFWNRANGWFRVAEDLGVCVMILIPLLGLVGVFLVLRQSRGYLHLAGYRPGLVFVQRPADF